MDIMTGKIGKICGRVVSLSANIEGAWVTLRDFNAIMDLEERNGQPVRESESVDMHEIMYGKVWSGGYYV